MHSARLRHARLCLRFPSAGESATQKASGCSRCRKGADRTRAFGRRSFLFSSSHFSIPTGSSQCRAPDTRLPRPPMAVSCYRWNRRAGHRRGERDRVAPRGHAPLLTRLPGDTERGRLGAREPRGPAEEAAPLAGCRVPCTSCARRRRPDAGFGSGCFPLSHSGLAWPATAPSLPCPPGHSDGRVPAVGGFPGGGVVRLAGAAHVWDV